MTPDEQSKGIARQLAALWSESKRPEFVSYVRSFHDAEVTHLPSFRCLFIGETEDGNLQSGPQPGILKQWWQVDDQGTREVSTPKMNWDLDTPSAPFFPTPVILFYCEDDVIVVSERLGQKMACWKRGRLERDASGVRVVDLNLLTET